MMIIITVLLLGVGWWSSPSEGNPIQFSSIPQSSSSWAPWVHQDGPCPHKPSKAKLCDARVSSLKTVPPGVSPRIFGFSKPSVKWEIMGNPPPKCFYRLLGRSSDGGGKMGQHKSTGKIIRWRWKNGIVYKWEVMGNSSKDCVEHTENQLGNSPEGLRPRLQRDQHTKPSQAIASWSDEPENM